MRKVKRSHHDTKPNLSHAAARRNKFWLRLNMGIVVLAVIAGVGFIACMNDIAIKSFVTSDLKKRVAELEKDNENLELEAVKLSSIESLDQRAQDLKMVRVDSIDYISASSLAVARAGGKAESTR